MQEIYIEWKEDIFRKNGVLHMVLLLNCWKALYSLFLIIAFVLVLYLVQYLSVRIVKRYARRNFSKRYKIKKLPKSVKVKRKRKKGNNYFILKFPYWFYSKKDGTADLRKKDNKIIWNHSTLHINNFLVDSLNPYDLLYVVKQLRLQGVEIDLCEEEKRKYIELKKKNSVFHKNMDIQKMIDNYEEKPTDFEKFCAVLFDKMGYHTRVTPPSNDGGYDIVLLRNNEKTIVECKCYSLKNKIGRPALQKLVGANNIALADKMIFITTSSFSSYAVSYAREVGMELIDGCKLMQFLKEYLFLEETSEININESYLEISDMRSYVPKDIFEEYFISFNS